MILINAGWKKSTDTWKLEKWHSFLKYLTTDYTDYTDFFKFFLSVNSVTSVAKKLERCS
jgi:hypothetical protein